MINKFKNQDKLIVAIDTPDENKVKEIVDSLDSTVNNFKIGLEQYVSTRGRVLDYLKNKNKNIFLDLKFHDIPNTVEGAIRAAVRENVWMLTMHVSDITSMRRAVEAAKDEAAKVSVTPPIILGVTVLTSMNEGDLNDIGCISSTEDIVLRRVALAKKAGLGGVVTSPKEVRGIVSTFGKEIVTVCPGIRPSWAESGDQKRIMTPKDAIEVGAHYLVIGRPITKAADMKEAAIKILSEMDEAK